MEWSPTQLKVKGTRKQKEQRGWGLAATGKGVGVGQTLKKIRGERKRGRQYSGIFIKYGMLEPLCQLWLYYVRGAPKLDISLTLKRLGEEKGVNLTPPVVFPKMFVTFNIIISHYFLKISLKFLKLLRRYEDFFHQY